MTNAVVQVIDESNTEIIYTLRIKGDTFRAKVFSDSTYTLKVGEPGTENIRVLRGLKPVMRK